MSRLERRGRREARASAERGGGAEAGRWQGSGSGSTPSRLCFLRASVATATRQIAPPGRPLRRAALAPLVCSPLPITRARVPPRSALSTPSLRWRTRLWT